MLSKFNVIKNELREAFNQFVPVSCLKLFGALRARNTNLSQIETTLLKNFQKKGFVAIKLDNFGISSEVLHEFEKLLDSQGSHPGKNKPYQHYLLGGDLDDTLKLSNSHLQQLITTIFMNKKLLDIVSGALDNTEPSFRYLEVVESRVMKAKQSDGIFSQKWHRDNGGKKVIKLFICMSDITNTDGPLEFIEGSHRTGKKSSHYPKKGFGARTTPSISNELVELNKGDICRVKGKKWAAFLCDTSGVHRGGNYNEGSYRKMATAAYYFETSSAPKKTQIP